MLAPTIAKATVAKNIHNQLWRLNHLYWIKDINGKRVQFKMNEAQMYLFYNMHFFSIILKARQLGFSTFILLYFLDCCLFQDNHAAGVIAQGLTEAEDLFDNKVKFAYENLPDDVRSRITAKTDSARQLEFSNGSSITVGTSLRGGTLQKLLVSEYGKISAKYPDKAMEIKTGALNTVHSGQQIFVESTAEGQAGEFFDLVTLARKLEMEKRVLSPLDPKFLFFPWWQHPDYKLSDVDTANTLFTADNEKYFKTLASIGIQLTRNQQAWYVKKEMIQQDKMTREYPSTPDESFAAAVEGAYYGKQMSYLRKAGMITTQPLWEPKELVYTWWDLGNFNYTAIWFFQQVAREWRMIRFHQASGDDLEQYAAFLREQPYNYGAHFLPHDGDHIRLGQKNKSTKQILESLGIKPIKIVPVSKSVAVDIETKCKPALMKCWIHAVDCADGIKCLDNYKREWDDSRAVWRDKPKHDEFSDGADAFRTFAAGYQPEKLKGAPSESMQLGAASTSFMGN